MLAGRPERATQAHEPSLYRVLRLLASLGVLAEQDGRSFGLTVLGERLRADVPASVRSWAMLVDLLGGVGAFEPIIETVRTGELSGDRRDCRVGKDEHRMTPARAGRRGRQLRTNG